MRRATGWQRPSGRPTTDFYPRSPCGERLFDQLKTLIILTFLSTLSLRRATARRVLGFVDPDISIHALLAESDSQQPRGTTSTTYFYPRSPCGERHDASALMKCQIKFLSTLSLRRATFACAGWFKIVHHFYPRSPCGERPVLALCSFGGASDFYPRSPCGERPAMAVLLMFNLYFYPRSPCGERRYWPCVPVVGRPISIHALLAESDICVCWMVQNRPLFLSTLSLRRATLRVLDGSKSSIISIHALLAESDGSVPARVAPRAYFYPRSPCGERQPLWPSYRCSTCISIHALLAESDQKSEVFYHD